MPPEPVLVLAPEAPYPLAGGGALRTASLIHYFARTRPVDLIVFRQPGDPDPAGLLPAGLVRRVSVLDLPPTGRGQLARAIRNSMRLARNVPPLVDRFSGFEREVTAAIGSELYAIGVIEHSWCAPYWKQLASACKQTILDLHNVESMLHDRCAQVEGRVSALAHRWFSQASLALEREWFPRFSTVLTPSENDAGAVHAIVPGTRVAVYPNAIPDVSLPSRGDENAVVFSGNMEYHPNRSAVRFFRSQIWPALREQWPDLVWRLVGKNPQSVARFLSGDPRIQLVGPVDNAVRELSKSRIAVVPLLSGSGTRLKILEAWAAGLPVVSTTIGAEGLPVCNGEHAILADGASDFVAGVGRLLSDSVLRHTLGNAGRSLLEREFVWSAAWRKLAHITKDNFAGENI